MGKKSAARYYIEEVLLLILITIDVLGWVGALPADIEFGDKLISWLLMGILFYHVSFTNIFFGTRHKTIDAALVLTYFLFLLKNLTTLAEALLHHGHVYYHHFFDWLVTYSIPLETYAFSIGAAALVLIALYTVMVVPVRKPSVMHTFGENGTPQNSVRKLLIRFFKTHFLMTAFFIVVFNLIIEWLGMVEDDIITALSLMLVILIVVKYYKQGKSIGRLSEYVFKVTKLADSFYEKLIHLLQSKKKAMLTLSGLLALHLITDIATFIAPFLLWKHEIDYFGAVGSSTVIWEHIVQDLAKSSGISALLTGYVYVLNIVGILMLMIAPIALWYLMYTLKRERVASWLLALFYSAVSCFLLAPAFTIGVIEESLTGRIIGVDIATQSILTFAYLPLWSIALISLALACIVLSTPYRKQYMIGAFTITTLFFVHYIYNFLQGITTYYLQTIHLLLGQFEFMIAFYFMLFYIINILFYFFGVLFFIYEARKEVE